MMVEMATSQIDRLSLLATNKDSGGVSRNSLIVIVTHAYARIDSHVVRLRKFSLRLLLLKRYNIFEKVVAKVSRHSLPHLSFFNRIQL